MFPEVMIKGRFASCLEQIKRALLTQEFASLTGRGVHFIDIHSVFPDFKGRRKRRSSPHPSDKGRPGTKMAPHGICIVGKCAILPGFRKLCRRALGEVLARQAKDLRLEGFYAGSATLYQRLDVLAKLCDAVILFIVEGLNYVHTVNFS